MTNVEKMMAKVFASISQEEIEMVISRLQAVNPNAVAADENAQYQLRGVGCIFEGTEVKPDFKDASIRNLQALLAAAIDQDQQG